MRLYQETYFPLLYFYVMSAQTNFIVNGNWYSFHLNVSDVVHMCSSVTWEYEEQCYMTKNKYTCDVQNY
jgi:hypothetical protein